MNPPVSVIVPFRGRIPWVREAVDSVLAQSMGNLEIILVDDGSEESASFLNEFQDDRIRYIRQNPSGPAAARNSGIRVAMGNISLSSIRMTCFSGQTGNSTPVDGRTPGHCILPHLLCEDGCCGKGP